jgi:membrane protein DedA with SNARE-associated domain
VAGKILLAITTGAISAVYAGGYLGVIALMAVSCACIPIPSEVVMLAAGSLAGQGKLDLWLASAAGAIGCVVGSILAYWVGHCGGRPVVERYRRYLLISARDLTRADGWFARYGDATVCFSRMLPIIRAFISLPAGVARMPFGRFCLYTLLGSVPWCVGFAYLGYHSGRRWDVVTAYLHDFDVIILTALAAAVVWWVWRHVRHVREEVVAEHQT